MEGLSPASDAVGDGGTFRGGGLEEGKLGCWGFAVGGYWTLVPLLFVWWPA